MKISPLSEAVRFLNSVRERRDGGGDGRQPYEQEQKKKERESSPDEVTDDSVNRAVQAFESDPQTQANGIHASLEGRGPGLRVTLKDCNGAVLRQLTGDEFVRLQKAAASGGKTNETRSPGKILDQKL